MSAFDVLVVDDELDVRSYLQTVLQHEGLTVRCVPDAIEALSMIRQEKPQLMVLDLMMPQMTGDELCRIVKQDPDLKDIIIFILTSRGDLETKLSCFDSGAEEYLVKPVDSRELTARVGRFIKLVDELKGPFPQGKEDSRRTTTIHEEMPSLSLDDYSFLRFQSTYGTYRVESLVGRGGMGQVFKGHDDQLERHVAIKVLSSKLSNSHEFVERFRREGKLLASITHPGIASIYSFSEQKGEHYFAMQWCSGGSLAELIRKKGRLETMAAVDITLQCAQALFAASKKGVVHRDIKPSNLMFDENHLIKVVDFGLAFTEQISSNLTQGGEFLGTPSYMAPEQAKSPAVDHRADIYSLGITFYYMLYGQLPFQASSPIEMVIKHTSYPFPPYDDSVAKVPRDVYAIIERMTKKEPANRYQDYAALIQDLEQIRNEFLHQSQFRIPQATRIAPIAILTGGNFFELLATVLNQAQTGMLTCRWNALEKKFLIRKAEIILFESLQPDENVWTYMVHRNLLKKEDLPLNRSDLEQPLNRFLLNNTFTLEDFKKTYRELMLSALDQVFLWPVFEGTFATAGIENDAFCSIPIAEYLLEAARVKLDYEVLKHQIPAGTIIKRSPQFDSVLRALNLSPEESFIVSRLEGENLTVDTLNLLTGLPEEKIVRIVYAMEKFGVVLFKPAAERPVRRVEHTAGSPQAMTVPAKHAEATVPPSSTKSPPVAPAASTNKQKPKSSGLGPPGSSSSEYLLEMQRRRFAPPLKPAEPPPPPKESLVRMEVQKSEKKIEVEQHVKVAEQFYRIAERKYDDGDYYNVTSLCKQAISNNPTEAKYYLLMALAYAKHPRFLKDAQASFQKALELDPWNPDYHVALAEFYFGQGLSLRALNECKKALSITPGHQKALELHQILKDRDH